MATYLGSEEPPCYNKHRSAYIFLYNKYGQWWKENEWKNWFVDHLVGDKIITYISRQLSYKKKGEKKETTRFYFYNLHGINYTTRSRIWDSFIGVNGGKKVCRKYMIIQQRFWCCSHNKKRSRWKHSFYWNLQDYCRDILFFHHHHLERKPCIASLGPQKEILSTKIIKKEITCMIKENLLLMFIKLIFLYPTNIFFSPQNHCRSTTHWISWLGERKTYVDQMLTAHKIFQSLTKEN